VDLRRGVMLLDADLHADQEAELLRRQMDATHRDLAAGGREALSLAEQLGNIGSEISRAERWKTRNPEISRAAFFRALELLDLTLDDPGCGNPVRACVKSPARGRSSRTIRHDRKH